MKTKFTTNAIACILFCLSLLSCTEPYQIQTNTFEDALVVEATITNELKTQQIKISRTYQFEENGPTTETGADVYITDNLGNRYDFTEQNGVYLSTVQFQAVPNVNYQLFITTVNGNEYASNIQRMTTANQISSIDTDIITKDSERGVQISVNSSDPTNTSKFYRYEYEETYKVVVPKWSNYKAYLLNPRTVSYMERGYESKTCFKTNKSDTFLLTNTTDLMEDLVYKFPIRFIGDREYMLSERYSILVRQFVISQQAYEYYKTIKALSDSGELLSPNQPGFVMGNIKSLTNPKEKIIGFFDVCSASEKRIFFNYGDVFPNEPVPQFFMDCPEESLDAGDFRTNPLGDGFKLISYVQSGQKVFYDFIYNPLSEAHPIYVMVPAACGDCTTFASNVVPPFWQ